jgi:hypothetical protein
MSLSLTSVIRVKNITNLDECLVGLCANCVCTHTELHISKGTAP